LWPEANYRAGALHDPVQRGGHSPDHRMANPALNVLDDLSSRSLGPAPIEGLSRHPELDEQVLRIIRRLRLAALLAPEAKESGGPYPPAERGRKDFPTKMPVI
jgi:hypothetical protein